MDRFEQGVSKNLQDEDFDSLIKSLKVEINGSKAINDSAISNLLDENNYLINEIPDIIFKEGDSLNIIKNLYVNELTNLKLKQAIASKLVEKEIYKQ